MKKFNLDQNLFTVSESFTNAVSYWRYALVSAGNFAEADKLQKKLSAKDAKSRYTENQILGMQDSVAQFMAAGKKADDEAGKLALAEADFVTAACTANADGIQNRPETVRLYLRIFAAGQDTTLKRFAWESLSDTLTEGAYNALMQACFACAKDGRPTVSTADFKSVKEAVNAIMGELSLPVAVGDICAKTMLRANSADAQAAYLTFVKSVKAELDKDGSLTGKLSYGTAISKKTDKKSGETSWNNSAFLRTMQELVLAKLAK